MNHPDVLSFFDSPPHGHDDFRIRYTAVSLPYHIGNGWFGGFLPITAFAIVAATGNIYAGLMYPIIVAAMTFILGVLFLPETRGRDIIN
jgi:hypothetical protein